MRRARGCCGRDRLRICVNFTNLEVFLSIPNCQRWAISHQTCEAWARWESSRFWTGDLCDLLDLTCDLSEQSLIYLSIQSEITPVDRLLRCINATIQDFHERETMRACVSKTVAIWQEKRQQFLHLRQQSGDSDAKWSQQQCGVALQAVRKYCHFFPTVISICTGDGSPIFTKSSC